MQRRLRVITLQGAIKNEWLDGNIIISYFGGRNNIFADCIFLLSLLLSQIFELFNIIMIVKVVCLVKQQFEICFL